MVSDVSKETKIPYLYARENRVFIDKELENYSLIKSEEEVSIEIFSELRRYLNKPIRIEYVDNEEFEVQLAKHYSSSETSSEVIKGFIPDEDLHSLANNIPKTSDLLDSDNEAPVIKLLNSIISEAIKSEASDIHIEPFEDYLSIRFRVDGVLKEVLRPTEKLTPMINARIKVMSNLDIAEKRIPQDGRMSLKLGEKWIDIRVSTLPSNYGERIVLRLLDKSEIKLDLNDLGMDRITFEKFSDSITSPNGIVLVTGPTGSGKTTTLYAALNLLNNSEKNILTVEDPIEYSIEGIGQTQINPKVGLTFSQGLRAILRQDPDIVLIGEIRDLETAEIAIQASLTGHLVLATIHTNDSVSAITRMIDMGVESYLLASTLRGVLAQRLVRKLCNECKTTQSLQEDYKTLKKDSKVNYPSGCNKCNNSGFKGRTGIFEIFNLTNEIKNHIHKNSDEQKLRKLGFSDHNTLLENGLEMIKSGKTSIDEIISITKE
tara:strand:- start:956 stop:2422 length:1467 start_codon:yes stop_codon:yes gene_type:complete